jgi:hypothetical protein
MIGWLINVEMLVEWELAGEREVLGENLPQCNFTASSIRQRKVPELPPMTTASEKNIYSILCFIFFNFWWLFFLMRLAAKAFETNTRFVTITHSYIDGQKNKYSVLNECNRMLKTIYYTLNTSTEICKMITAAAQSKAQTLCESLFCKCVVLRVGNGLASDWSHCQ